MSVHAQALQRNAARAQQSPALKTEADLLQSQRLLPQAMDLVRAAFGPKGPVVKQREEVSGRLRRLKSGRAEATAGRGLRH